MRGSNPDRRSQHPPPPTPSSTFNPWAHQFPPPPTRDSDASYASSLPQHPTGSGSGSALSVINQYISSALSLPPIRTPLSTRDTALFRHLLLRLGLPEDDLPLLLRSLGCPVKFNKSALRAPGERRASAMLVGALHWLVQLCQYCDALQDRPLMPHDGMFLYVRDCYAFYVAGEDDSVAALDEELLGKLEAQGDAIREHSRALEGEIREMEDRLEGSRSRPRRVEELENEEKLLEEDISKLRANVKQFRTEVDRTEKEVQDKDEKLRVKIDANMNICEENREIEKQVQEQLIKPWDAERMKRELQVLDAEIKATEEARSEKAEKVWKVTSDIEEKLRELDERLMQCNQAVRRLKLGSGLQYQLNAKGSTPAEVLGIDYKTTLKPTLAASLEDAKRAYVEKWEEVISLKKQASDSESKIKAKKSRISTLEAQIKEVEAKLDKIEEETQSYTSNCSADAQKIAKQFEAEASNMVIAESNAAHSLKVSEAKLQEAITEAEEKVQLCARNLFSVVDSVSKFKEHVALKMSEMKTDLSETSVQVADAHKYSLPVMFQHVEDK